jgi:hypothetical protein
MLIQIERDADGFPILIIEDMDKTAKKFFRDLMMLNQADEEVLTRRSRAGAHLVQWDSVLGTAGIVMHGESIASFINYIESSLMVRVVGHA